MKLKREDKKGCQVKTVKKVAGAPARQRFVVAAAAFIRIDVGQNRTSLKSLESFGDGKELDISTKIGI